MSKCEKCKKEIPLGDARFFRPPNLAGSHSFPVVTRCVKCSDGPWWKTTYPGEYVKWPL
jgi:hypothetical protein